MTSKKKNSKFEKAYVMSVQSRQTKNHWECKKIILDSDHNQESYNLSVALRGFFWKHLVSTSIYCLLE